MFLLFVMTVVVAVEVFFAMFLIQGSPGPSSLCPCYVWLLFLGSVTAIDDDHTLLSGLFEQTTDSLRRIVLV
jgi:TRAP-type C4-dicarboxylate transport system permease small subunit